jgi:hypothetical protein
MRFRAWTLCALLCAAPIAHVWAGPLEPSLASQVLLVKTSTPCAIAQTGSHSFDERILKNGGAISSYEVPAKKVAVIRSVRFNANAEAGTSVTVILDSGGNGVAVVDGITDAAGHFDGTFEFDPGLPVSSLANLCIRTGGVGSVSAMANGFLARDK